MLFGASGQRSFWLSGSPPAGARGAQAERARGRDATARVLPEPGVGVEEGVVIVNNEMALVVTLAARGVVRVGSGTGGTA